MGERSSKLVDFIESFWSSLKYELVYYHRFATHAEARTAIFDYIETFYNRTRLHSSIAYTSPITFEPTLKLNTASSLSEEMMQAQIDPYLTVRIIGGSPELSNDTSPRGARSA